MKQTDNHISVTVDDGKYVFYTKSDDYRIFCDRNDVKEWMIFDKGSKALLALMRRASRTETWY